MGRRAGWDLTFGGTCMLSRHLATFGARAWAYRLVSLVEVGYAIDRGVLGPVAGAGGALVTVPDVEVARFRVRVGSSPALSATSGRVLSPTEVRRLAELGLLALSGRVRASGGGLGSVQAAGEPSIPAQNSSSETDQLVAEARDLLTGFQL
ncbi:hypothetical protein C7S18_23645 (plasmid) [Ahniella affigens]|uniref:Uncharacterized protein n=1 Tax=Ahniella affigens TaxID=2021234 RepID=A0A2P1PZM0_9GAMM|nr:hypothetical protein C7S18_23645 [Ahniella affigens]